MEGKEKTRKKEKDRGGEEIARKKWSFSETNYCAQRKVD